MKNKEKMTSQRRQGNTFLVLASIFIGVFLINLASAAVWDPTKNVGLVSYWKLDESSGTVIDSLGLNNGANVGAIAGATGIINTGYGFNGISGYINVSDSASLDAITKNITISLWVKPNNIAGSMDFVQKFFNGAPTDNGFEIIANEGTLQFNLKFVGQNFAFQVTNYSVLTAGVWNFIVCQWNGTTMNIYINGTLQTSYLSQGAYGTVLSPSTRPLQIGVRNDGIGQFTNGTIDEIGIWNRTLSNNEINDLYNGGVGMSYTTIIPVILLSPSNNTNIFSSSQLFNASYPLPSGNFTNATVYLWNSTGYLIGSNTTTINTSLAMSLSNIPVSDNMLWNYIIAYKNNTGTFYTTSVINYTISRKLFLENSQKFNSVTSSGGLETFIINASYDNAYYNSILANLIYNGTAHIGTKTGAGSNIIFTSTFNVPTASTVTTFPFYWNFTLINGGTTNYTSASNNQTVNPIFLDDCSVYTNKIFNLTLYDEESELIINGTINVNIVLYDSNSNNIIANFSKNYLNKNSALICIQNDPKSSRDYSKFEYTSPGYVTRNYYIQNFVLNNITQNIGLYNLNSTSATLFLIGYKDSTYLSVPNALINIQREYTQEGVFKTVEVGQTDSNGQATGYFDITNGVYTITVTKDGVLLDTFPHVTISCQTNVEKCQINLYSKSAIANPVDFNTYNNLRYSMTINQTTGLIDVLFSSIDGSSNTILLNVTKFDGYMNTTLCSNSATTSSGEVMCSISTTGNYSAYVGLYMNGQLITNSIITFNNMKSIFQNNQFIYIFILVLTIPMMFIPSAIGAIVGVLMAVIAAVLIFGIGGTTIIGVGSMIMLIVIAGIILIWRIQQRGTE